MTTCTAPSGVLSQFVQRARELYSLPAVALRVLELSRHPKVDARALKDCLEKDPALTSKILRTVNSSLFGLKGEVSDLNQALALLGTKPLKMLVLGFSLPKRLLARVEASVLERYWRHSLIKAVAARLLSQRFWRSDGDDAFVAGLLQDVGVLVLVQNLGSAYVDLFDECCSNGGKLSDAETAALGFDHAVLSARLLEHWGLPASIVRAVETPHDRRHISSLFADEQPLAQVLHLADLIASLVIGGETNTLAELMETAAAYRPFTLEQFEALVSELERQVPQLAEVLSLELPASISFVDVLAVAHEELAHVAADAVGELSAACGAAPRATPDTDALRRAADQFSQDAFQHFVSMSDRDDRPESVGTATTRNSSAASHEDAKPTGSESLDRYTDDPGLNGRVTLSVEACRRARCPVSLALIEIDNFNNLLLERSFSGADKSVRVMERLIDKVRDTGDTRMRLDDGRFAVVCGDCDRGQAVTLANQLLGEVRRAATGRREEGGGFTASIGVATLSIPSRNFPAHELIAAAQRCLNAAKASGGDGSKSIEL